MAMAMADKSDWHTLDEALDAIGFGKFQVNVLAYAGVGYAAAATETMIVSFIGDSVKTLWKLSSTQETLLSSVIFAGILIGAYIIGLIADNHGRRKGILFTAAVTSGAGFLTAFAPNYISLLILRFLVGVGIGGSSVYLSWFLEFVPPSNRGTWLVLFTSFNAVGNIIEAALAWMIMPRLGWRWLLALSSLPGFVPLLFYNIAPESPRYLCSKGETTDAHTILKAAATINKTQLPSGILVTDDHHIYTAATFDEEDTWPTYPLLRSLSPKTIKTTDNSITGFSTLRLLFSSSLLRTTLLLWVLFFGNNFAYYGIILLTSKLTSGQSDCITVVSLQSHLNSHDLSYIDILVASFADLPGILLSAIAIDRIGRKISMGIMFVVGFIFILPLLSAGPDENISTIISLFATRMFIVGTYTIGTIYALEVYPTSVRATGIGLASSAGGIGGMVCPLIAVGLLNNCHQTTAIVLFEFVIIVSGICVLLFPIETKGRELSDNVFVN